MKWRVVQQGNGVYAENRLDFTFIALNVTGTGKAIKQLSLTQICFENAAVAVENCAVFFN